MSSQSLQDRTIVVTGVTSGIGEALATRLVQDGARVVGLGRNETTLAALAARLGERFVPLTVDLSMEDERARAIARICERFDRIFALVNNAAECVYETPTSLPLDRWKRLLEVDFVAALDIVKGLVDRLPTDGHVVTVSSVTTQFLAHPAFAPYAIAKTALERLTEALRLELAPRGLAVTVVRPGLVATPLYDKVGGFERTRARLEEAVPDWLRADDVADSILWILSRPHPVVVSEMTILPRTQAR